MNLRDHFSEKEIKNLNGLEKRLKMGKWAFAFISIMLVSFSFMSFYLAYILSKMAGIEDVFSVLFNVEVEEDYIGIVSHLNYLVVCGIMFIILLINNFVKFIFLRKYMEPNLVRCWNLLSSLSEDNQDFGKSLK